MDFTSEQLDLLAGKAQSILAARDFAAFVEYVLGYEVYPHIRMWADLIQDPNAQRVQIVCPPGHGKTTIWSIAYPSWYLGNFPQHHVILLSNTDSKATEASVAIRSVIENNPRYHEVFPKIAPDKAKGWGQDRWYLKRTDEADKNPSVSAYGVSSDAILGSRANLMIIDDVCTEQNQATSYQREKLKKWIKTTAFSRFETVPGSRCVAVATRWHEEDVAADLLTDPAWTPLHMPAVGYWGANTPLCPQIMTLDKILAIKNDPKGGKMRFENMYQGNPSVPEGSIIKRIWWKHLPFEQFPKREDCEFLCQSWDTAFKKGAENDYSVCLTAGLYKGNIFFFSVFRDKLEFPDLLAKAKELFQQWRPRVVLVEDKASGISLVQQLQTVHNPSLPIVPVKADTDQLARVNAQTGYIEAGRAWLPAGNEVEPEPEWVEPFLLETAAYPNAAHDDQVIACIQAIGYLTANENFSHLSPSDCIKVRAVPNEFSRSNWDGMPSGRKIKSFLDNL